MAEKHVREKVDQHIDRIRRVVRYGVSHKLVDDRVLFRLKTLEPLKRGRSNAKESSPVQPVPHEHIKAVLPYLTKPVAAMVQLQALTVVSHLRKHHCSFAPVVKEDGGLRKIIGVVSEADCLEHLSNELFHSNPRPPRSAATFMTRHPICVEPDTDLFVLASILVSHNIRQVSVVDKADHLLGIVSRHTVEAL